MTAPTGGRLQPISRRAVRTRRSRVAQEGPIRGSFLSTKPRMQLRTGARTPVRGLVRKDVASMPASGRADRRGAGGAAYHQLHLQFLPGLLSEPLLSLDTALIMAVAARTPCSWACWLTVVRPHQRDMG